MTDQIREVGPGVRKQIARLKQAIAGLEHELTKPQTPKLQRPRKPATTKKPEQRA